MRIYAVVFGNYDPIEIDDLFFRREDAEARAAELGGMWEVAELFIHGTPTPEQVAALDSMKGPAPHAADCDCSSCRIRMLGSLED